MSMGEWQCAVRTKVVECSFEEGSGGEGVQKGGFVGKELRWMRDTDVYVYGNVKFLEGDEDFVGLAFVFLFGNTL